MKTETIWDIGIKRKNAISFLLYNPGMPSDIINLCLDYIDALANEQDILIRQHETASLFSK